MSVEDRIDAITDRVHGLESVVYGNGKPGLRETQSTLDAHLNWHNQNRNENVMTRNAMVGVYSVAAASVFATLVSLAIAIYGSG